MPVVYLGYPADEDEQSTPLESWLQSRCGGTPGWLYPPPLTAKWKCHSCMSPLVFLGQVYSPRESVSSYHRMLYLFACWHCGKEVKCLRMNASREYGMLPSSPDHPDANKALEQLKAACMTQSKCCEVCLIPSEEGAVHQQCANSQKGLLVSPVFPRKDIVVEKEPNLERVVDPRAEELAKGCIIEEVAQEDTDEEEDICQSSTPPVRIPINEDAVLDAYINYMEMCPGHVVRYGDDNPMWFCSEGQPTAEPDPCPQCNMPRCFEFQIQSTLLDCLGMISNLELSFGVLAVYTCQNDCKTISEEFIYKQRDPTVDIRIRLQEEPL